MTHPMFPLPVPCGNTSCVEVQRTESGRYRFTSTLGADRGAVEYDPSELATFLDEVKSGKYDGLHDETRDLS